MAEKSKYTTLYAWKKDNESAYKAARKLGLLKKICEYFGWTYSETTKKRKSGFWTLERCIEEAKKYTSKNEWKRKSRGSYSAASKNRWIDKCCSHITTNHYTPVKPPNYWNRERCLEEARKYITRMEWKKASRGSYEYASKNNFIKEFTEHMVLSKYATRKV